MKENELIPGARYVPHQKTVGHPTWVIWDCLKNSETPYITYLGKNTDSMLADFYILPKHQKRTDGPGHD